MKDADPSLAVLISGGLDSAILLGRAVESAAAVHPLYMRFGLVWEDAELAHLQQYLAAVACPVLRPLQVLRFPVDDLYADHWSRTGTNVPQAGTADDAVFLPGRNVFLLAKALVWCHLRTVSSVALGSLGSNPFPDATPEFFRDFTELINRAVGGTVQLRLPFRSKSKREVMNLGRDLPLQYTFSCMRPIDELHCGACNKCAERKDAFAAAGMPDPTPYRSG